MPLFVLLFFQWSGIHEHKCQFGVPVMRCEGSLQGSPE